MTNNTNSNWPRIVINITELREKFDEYKVDIRAVLEKVLAKKEHTSLVYKKRFQHRRFVSILGAIYSPDSTYNDKEKEKHLLKLKKYYKQEAKKSKNGHQYLSASTAEFYCDLLDAIKEQVEADYIGIKLPTEEISKPLTKEEIEKEKGNGGKGVTKKRNNKEIPDKKPYPYKILDLSKLSFISADQMYEYCQKALNSVKDSGLLSTTRKKDQVLQLIEEIQYAHFYSKKIDDDNRIKTHTDHIVQRVSYKEGSSLTKEKQELDIEFLDRLKDIINEEIKAGRLNGNVVEQEIRILWPPKDKPNDKELDSYTSDEWNQMLTIASKTSANAAANLTEGIAVSALKEVLGELPKNWDNMTLDEQEDVIKNLSPVQMSKFNIKVTQAGEKLAETLPPNFLVSMVQNIDKSLESNKIKDEEKTSLNEQKNIIIKAMLEQINQAPNPVKITPENAAGAYEGFVAMVKYLRDNKNNLPDGLSIEISKIERILKALEEAIKKYDEMNGLQNVDEKSSDSILEAYTDLQKDLKDKKIEDMLDDETKNIFDSLEFPETIDEKGEKISSQENKQLFIDAVVNIAIQKTAVANHDKDKAELKEAFKKQLTEDVILETATLILAQESVNKAKGKGSDFNIGDDITTTKQKLTDYISSLSQNKVSVSNEALAGYFAATVNKQSLFVNRLATKLKNRTAVVLHKMWQPFRKIDKTCINRFGKAYTLSKAILKNQLKNLPWTLGMGVARVAAFSLAATPYGWAAVAAYGAVSVGTTVYRMIKNYKQQKKDNPNLKPSDFFKQNWSGMLLSAVGTAASVVPGLAASVEGLQVAVDAMKGCGLLAQTSVPLASSLGMTNLSVAMVGASMADSTVRGTIAQRKEGESLGKSLLYGGLSGIVSNAVGITTSVGCAQACNAMFDSGMNLIGDTRTMENIVDSPNGNMEREVTPQELSQRIDSLGLRDELDSLENGNLTQAQYNETLTEVKETLAREGLVLKPSNEENADISIKWSETVVQATEEAINNSTDTVKYWTSSDPEVYEANIKTLTPIIEEYNAKHPEAPLDVHRAYHTMLLMGARAVGADVDTLQNHVNGGGTVDCKGMHTVITDNHISKHPEWNVSTESAQAVRGVTDSNGLMNPDKLSSVIDTIATVEKHVSEIGEVGQNASTRDNAHTDGVLSQNATIDQATGEHVQATQGKGTLFDTYVDGDSAHKTTHTESSENFEVVQRQENQPRHIYMPLNPEPMVFEGTKRYLAKIMGNNINKPDKKIPIDLSKTGIKDRQK